MAAALGKLLSYPNNILSHFFSTTFPQLLRILILLVCITWRSYKLLSTEYNYASTINARSSKFRYRKKKAVPEHLRECRVCLTEFADGEEVREVADCRHAFHGNCLEKWLTEYKPTCPLCRSSVVPPGAVAEYRKMREEDEEDRWLREELALLLLNALDGKGCVF